jgi:phosphoribosylamine--glycine ligase
MGSYKDAGEVLPFMTNEERRREVEIVNKVFTKLKSKAGGNSDLRGVPFYTAFMHTGRESKILENNSRPGDPEIMNILLVMKDDFVDICFKILEGNLTHVEFENKATVFTYKAPPDYGGYADAFPRLVNKEEADTQIDMTRTTALLKESGDAIRIYPASMELRGEKAYARTRSRTIGVLGISDSIETARQISLKGLESIRGGGLWNRTDIASEQHIEKSKHHMDVLRRKR